MRGLGSFVLSIAGRATMVAVVAMRPNHSGAAVSAATDSTGRPGWCSSAGTAKGLRQAGRLPHYVIVALRPLRPRKAGGRLRVMGKAVWTFPRAALRRATSSTTQQKAAGFLRRLRVNSFLESALKSPNPCGNHASRTARPSAHSSPACSGRPIRACGRRPCAEPRNRAAQSP